MSITDVEKANEDVPPLQEQENPTIFDGDIEAANEAAPDLADQEGPKTELGESLHPKSVTFGIAYSQYATDGAGHGPDYFVSETDADGSDDSDDSGSGSGRDKPGKGPKSRAASKK